MSRTFGAHTWADHEIDTLRRMRSQGATLDAIAKAMGRPRDSVISFIRAYQDVYGLHVNKRRAKAPPNFDKLWLGSMPYLHWAMTKQWGNK